MDGKGRAGERLGTSKTIEALETELAAATTPHQKVDALNALAWELRALGDRLREGKVLTNIALAYAAQGQYEHALVSARQCLELNIDSSLINGYIFLALGQIYAGLQESDKALGYLQQALRCANQQSYEQLSLAALHTMGQVYLNRKEASQAIEYLAQALALAEAIVSNLYVFRCHETLSQVYERQGDLAQALAHYKQFHSAKETLFNDKNAKRLQVLGIHHQAEIARREAEIYQLRNVELEQEIAERKRLEKELHQQATTDILTGVSNRRHFLDLARTELTRSVRHKHPLALALIDLDHFKAINDLYGHVVGDQALKALVSICQNNIRQIDVFARFGGDEFVLLMPETNCEQAYAVVERLRLALTAKPFVLHGNRVSIRVSSGVVSLTGENESLDILLMQADQALYQAKNAGRNRVVTLSATGMGGQVV